MPAGDDLNIVSDDENGIRAEDTSIVDLNTAQCTIEAAEDAILEHDTAEIDVSGCNELMIPSVDPS